MPFKLPAHWFKSLGGYLIAFFFSMNTWGGADIKVPAPYVHLAMLSQVPFSADVNTQVTGSGIHYVEHETLRVSRHRMRRELKGLEDPRATDVLISDFEHREDYGSYGLSQFLEVYWVIGRPTPDDQLLTEADIDSVMDRFRWRDSDWERLGNERVNGLQAIRYLKVEEAESDTELYAWFTANEGVLCQIEVVGPNRTATTRFENIEVGAQPDSAFEMPESYARVSHQHYLGWMMTHSPSNSDEPLKGHAAAEAIEAASAGAKP